MNSRLTLLLTISLALPLHAPPSAASSSAPSPSPTDSDSDFLRQTCSHTLYPDVCYTSLSAHANSISQSPNNLARAAVNVCLAESRLASAYFSNLSRSSDCRAALRDCASTLSAAASQVRDSLKQMCQIGANPAGHSARATRFQISNVQTWMSAALTNEDTCTDGFEDVADGPVKSDACDRVARVRKLTSNALALVNFYASTVAQ